MRISFRKFFVLSALGAALAVPMVLAPRAAAQQHSTKHNKKGKKGGKRGKGKAPTKKGGNL